MIRNLLSIILFLLFMPLSGWATVLYLEPAEGEYYPGDVFMVEARIDTEGECINTVKAEISFSQDILGAIDFSRGNSILSFWVSQPRIIQESGLISFAGGIPGGYCGRLLGDPGESNLLGRIIFKIKSQISTVQNTEVKFLDTSQVLLNDGLGTPAKLTTEGAIFAILPGIPEISKREWQEELEKDKIPPEDFEIEISQSPTIFEEKYFISFSATDKQTGIDHYEVKEGKGDWERVNSPYLLKDQSLESTIKVRAIDKAGNERIAEYLPAEKPFPYWIIILILMGAGIIYWIIKRNRRKTDAKF